MSKNVDESFLLKIKTFTLALYTPWQKKTGSRWSKEFFGRQYQVLDVWSPSNGEATQWTENEAPLQTTESILREDTSAFWYEKEAEESVDGRWSYLDRFLNLSHQMLPSRNTLQPNKKNTNPSNTKTYTTETSEYKLSKCYCFTGKDVEFMKYRVLSSYL